jgi:ComF family protein
MMSFPSKRMQWMGRFFLDGRAYFFPERCWGCRRYLGIPMGNHALDPLFCSACRSRILFIEGKACPRCGQPGAAKSGACRRCRGFASGFLRCAAAAAYHGLVRELVLRLKFGGNKGVAFPLARLAVPAARRLRERHPMDCVVPVPLHPARQRDRGFNQAEMIAEVLARTLDLPLLRGVVKRVKNTLPQGTGGGGSRRENVRGAFQPLRGGLLTLLRGEAPAWMVRGQDVLLVDDVLSTGATMDFCARSLLQAGARTVIGVAVAT